METTGETKLPESRQCITTSRQTKKETMADKAYGRPGMHLPMVRDKRGEKCRGEKCPEIQQCIPTGAETRGETDGRTPAMHTHMKGNDGRVASGRPGVLNYPHEGRQQGRHGEASARKAGHAYPHARRQNRRQVSYDEAHTCKCAVEAGRF